MNSPNDLFTIFADLIRRTRQHHAIEHATIHVLGTRFPGQSFSGHSDPLGFTIYGAIGEGDLRRAVGDALLRLQAGESGLARHPNCGTNLVVTGVLVTLVALLFGGGRRSGAERFATMLLGVLPALVLARPLGYHFQRYTTLADVADRWVAEIQPVKIGQLRAQRVIFE
jgi:hypothetical protein